MVGLVLSDWLFFPLFILISDFFFCPGNRG